MQFIDARDLAEWIVRTIEARRTGIFNADGPATLLTMRQLLEKCVSVCGAAAHLTWVDEKFLIGVGVKPWSEMPVWFPAAEASFNAVNCAKAMARVSPSGRSPKRSATRWHGTRRARMSNGAQASASNANNNCCASGMPHTDKL